MNRSQKLLSAAIFASISLAGCARIETGEVGLRVGFDKQVSANELQPGSWNQTMFGEVLTFPIREIRVVIENERPQASDNSTLADFDMSLIYTINSASVSDLWTTKSRSFHYYDEKGKDYYLMYHYMENVIKSSIAKIARKYEALAMADHRLAIETAIKAQVLEALKAEGLEGKITISQVQVTNILPAQVLIDSANLVIQQQNALKAKTIEVQTAEQEAKRIAMLNSNAKAIEYMNAQANMKIAEGIQNGKVHTIIVPYDFKGMVNANSVK